MPATTNLGEAQHACNNVETGTQMGIIELFKKYVFDSVFHPYS
jgi:hypothetical protein